MIGRSRRFSETRRMPSRRFREAEEHEYTFLLCLSCNAFRYKNDVFIEKTVTAENLAGAVDKLMDSLSDKSLHGMDDAVDDFAACAESMGYDPSSEMDFADYLVSQSRDGDIDPCYLGIMKDGKELVNNCLKGYMGGYDPSFRAMYWRSIVQKIKRGTLNLDKWGYSLQSVEQALRNARRYY